MSSQNQHGKGKGPNNIGGKQQSQHGGGQSQQGDKPHTSGAGTKDHASKGHSTK